ncbi:hypothetical protein GCM10020229_13150 [Kitasatospora albolonga]|uniref:CGNR zinc finger domain-containing protein n=1 Tax=Kitasatospora albolonga TaxID=68173 RepID=UPI0031E9123D
MADPLIGEPLALDLLNTRPRDGDQLADPAALRRWLELQEARGLLEVPAVTGPAELTAVREVRELAVVAVGRVRRGEPVPGAVLDALNARLLAAPLVGELLPGPAGPVYRLRRTGPASARLAGELAEAVAELVTGGEVLAAVRDCAAEDCALMFVPANPRRRWCSRPPVATAPGWPGTTAVGGRGVERRGRGEGGTEAVSVWTRPRTTGRAAAGRGGAMLSRLPPGVSCVLPLAACRLPLAAWRVLRLAARVVGLAARVMGRASCRWSLASGQGRWCVGGG